MKTIRREDAPKGLPILKLTSMSCRFIISDEGKPVRYCGEEKKREMYCEQHYKICYVAPKK